MDIATLTALSKLLFDGLAVVIMIILFIKSNKKRQKEFDAERKEYQEMNNEIRDNYNAMIKDIVQGVAKRHLTYEESKGLIQIEKQINDIINGMLKDTGASRVCIVKYHNGNKDMTGKSFLKMSMTNEVVNIGIAPMMADFKDIFRSLLSYWCHELEEKEICVIKDAEEIKDVDITMYQYLITRHIESKYGTVLKDNDGNILGFICIEYLDKTHFDIDKINETIQNNLPKIQTLVSIDGGMQSEL